MIVVKGSSGLSRRQKAALTGSGESFPPLPSKALANPLINKIVDRSITEYPLAAYSRRGGLRSGDKYANMLVNPFVSESQRYPDETIVPTAIMRFNASTTFTVDATGAASGFVAYQNWKVRTANNTAGSLSSTFTYPTNFGSTPVYRDYGAPQTSWAALSTVDRTLACGIRVRHMGLPTSTFVPSGTLYFLQLQVGEWAGNYSSESACIQAVTAKKGFSLTVAEMARLGSSVHIPYLPQGPMSYVFSSPTDAASGYPDNGTPTDQSVAANNCLLIVGFGCQNGTIFRFDYAHHVEYIPGVTAAGLVDVRVEPPSVAEREKVSAIAADIHHIIGGGTTAPAVAVLNSDNPVHVIRGGGSGPVGNPFGSAGGSTISTMVDIISAMSGLAPHVAKLFG